MEKPATSHLVNVPPRCFENAVTLWDAELVVAEVLVARTPLVLPGAVGEVVEPVACVAAQNNITFTINQVDKVQTITNRILTITQ